MEKVKKECHLHAAAKATREAWEVEVRQAVKAGSEPPAIPSGAHIPLEPERPRILTADVTPERLGTLTCISLVSCLA